MSKGPLSVPILQGCPAYISQKGLLKAKPGSHWYHASVWVLNPMTIHCVRGSRPWQVTGSELPKGCCTGRRLAKLSRDVCFPRKDSQVRIQLLKMSRVRGRFPIDPHPEGSHFEGTSSEYVFFVFRFWNQRKHRTCPRPLSRSWPASSQRAGLGPQRPRCQAAADSATPKKQVFFFRLGGLSENQR